MGNALPPLRLESVPDLNWVAISQAALQPVGAGRSTIHGTHDRSRVPRSPNAILIDTGEAFGTAHHATTFGCLLAIERLTRRRAFARILDLAVAVANAKANGVERRIAFACASGLAHPWLRHAAPFDLVIANILAGPLRALAADVGKAVRGGGTVILSGLLEPEAPAVIAAYGAHKFALVEHRRIAGWSTLTLLRRG